MYRSSGYLQYDMCSRTCFFLLYFFPLLDIIMLVVFYIYRIPLSFSLSFFFKTSVSSCSVTTNSSPHFFLYVRTSSCCSGFCLFARAFPKETQHLCRCLMNEKSSLRELLFPFAIETHKRTLYYKARFLEREKWRYYDSSDTAARATLVEPTSAISV